MTSRTPQIIAAEIANWDRQDVSVLRDLIAELAATGADIQHYVDLTALPSAPIPPGLDTSYPVWAVDARGWALVGADATDVEAVS